MNVYTDPTMTAAELRAHLYAGDLVVRTDLTAVADLVDHTRERLAELFGPHDPVTVHEHIAPEEMNGLLRAWKPAFIHDERSKALVRRAVEEIGFSPETTHYDLPKPRTSFPSGHLSSGAAFAFPWHRDAWYSAPRQQVNWWLPVFAVQPDNAMAFDPAGFGTPVDNDSAGFDYYALNAGRGQIGASTGAEIVARPGAHGHAPEHVLTVLPAPGSVLLFAGAQLHRTIPNTSTRSRFSVDFRTVDATDLAEGRGAPVVDAACTGTAVRDFVRVSDGAAFDEDFVVGLFGAPPEGAQLVYAPG